MTPKTVIFLGSIIDQDTLYWLLSTVAQTYSAIVGVIGFLVVYRLEGQSRVRDLIRDRLLRPRLTNGISTPSHFIRIFSNAAYGWSADDMVYHYENMPQESKQVFRIMKTEEEDSYRYLVDEMRRINNSRVLTSRIVASFFLFFGFHLIFVIIPSLVSLLFTSRLLPEIKTLFGLTAILVLVSLIFIAVVARYLLKTTKKDFPLKHPL
jgi:hypothetical protein